MKRIVEFFEQNEFNKSNTLAQYMQTTNWPYKFAAYVTLLKHQFFGNLFEEKDNTYSGIKQEYIIHQYLGDNINKRNITKVWIWSDSLDSIDFSDPDIINTMIKFVKYMDNSVNFYNYIISVDVIKEYNNIKQYIEDYVKANTNTTIKIIDNIIISL